MNYKQTISYLFSSLPMYQRMGKTAFKKDLGNITKLCTHLANPQDGFDSIHIAGTNGKGTTAHLLASVFQAHGFKTGLYTSPHYKDFRERIKIDGNYIPEERVIDFVQQHKGKFEEIKPSFFEITVAMAFDFFRNEQVDIAIIETGLGGRLDSTNIVSPKLAVITNISLDHTNMLGDTIELIAAEKAGIIKKQTPVVIGEWEEQSAAVFLQRASEMGASISFAERQFSHKLLEVSLQHSHLNIFFEERILMEALRVNIRGEVLLKNVITCLESLRIWNKHHHKKRISEKEIRTGFLQLKKATNYMGRWHVIDENPLVIGESAHNPAAFEKLFKEIANLPQANLHIVLGVVEDKDLNASLLYFPKHARYYFGQADIPRAKDSVLLQKASAEFGLYGDAFNSIEAAFTEARKYADEKDLILICGSIFNLAKLI